METEGSLPHIQQPATPPCSEPGQPSKCLPPLSHFCRKGMARPHVADGVTACNMEGSCEYIEKAVAEKRQGVVLQLGVWASC